MTQQEAYDLASQAFTSPAAVQMGDRHVIGQWLALAELRASDLAVLKLPQRAVQVRGQGASWDEAAARAGLTVTSS